MTDNAAELQQITDDLRTSIAWMDLVMASLTESICVIDKNGTILFANDAFADMVGRVRILVLGEKIWDVLQLVREINGQPLITNETLAATWGAEAVTSLNGNYRLDNMVIELGAHHVPNLEQLILVMRDVTREQEIDRLKSEFMTLASHQLRTPLSAINWFSEMLLKNEAGELNPDQQEFIKNISMSGRRMTDIVGALLNVSRLESGQVIIEPKPTDVAALVRGVVDELANLVHKKQQGLTVHIAPDLPLINLDPSLINQAYASLITNASKYTQDGGQIDLTVKIEDGQLLSSVTDNGYGVPEEERRKIFQKFFRASNILKIETDGTGLGLYLVKTIVESSGGKVGFESQEGKGSTFWFSVPASGMKPKEGNVRLSDIAK
jgi:signal transduction histidine kinase